MEKKIEVVKNNKTAKLGFQLDDEFEEEDNYNNIDDSNMMEIDQGFSKNVLDSVKENIDKINTINKNLTNTGSIPKEYRKILVPMNKLKPLKENWPTIVKAIIDHMHLEIRMNIKSKSVELRTSDKTTSTSAMQKSEDFLKAFMCGFDLNDAIALLRLEDLYFETFDIKDVKSLKGDHLSRCIGRICGEKGKTKHAIENSTRTRMIVEGNKISLLGAYINVGMARNAVCSLILGAQPGKVYSQLKIMGRKLNEIA